MPAPRHLFSLIRPDGVVELSLRHVERQPLSPSHVRVAMEAAPINPSDLGVLLGPADPATLAREARGSEPLLTARLPSAALAGLQKRVGIPTPAGLEGVGRVIETGSAPSARALDGKRVAILEMGLYATEAVVEASSCEVVPETMSAEQAASPFVNPLTALCMVETLKREQHRAFIHTAAASALGQMLVKLCLEEKVPLVNVVRRAEHLATLQALGATEVLDSSQSGFERALTEACERHHVTLAFDAIGGGSTAATLLAAMERALARHDPTYQRYGTPVHKQVYLYGMLDPSPTLLPRTFGLSWGLGGWLVMRYLGTLPVERRAELRQRAIAGLSTTFATRYAETVTLEGLLDPEVLQRASVKASQGKLLVKL